MIDPFTTCENNLSLHKSTLFLKSIEKSDISSIYLGYKYPKDKEEKIIKLIDSDDSQLSHINVYRMDLSNDRFELVSNLIREGKTEVR